jgi:hypothetical protein
LAWRSKPFARARSGHASPFEQAPDARLHRGQHLRHVEVGETHAVKPQTAVPLRREHAVQQQRVHVDIQIECAAESLDHRHAAAAAAGDAVAQGARPKRALGRPHEHGDHRPAHVVAPRELVPQAVRQAEHPLPHRHVRQDVVNKVRGVFRHAAAAAARTKAAPLARKRDQPVQAAARAAETREPAPKPAALQERAKLVLHERGQAFAVAESRRLRQERLEVIANGLIKRIGAGTPWLIVERGPAHARTRYTARALGDVVKSGRFRRAEFCRDAEHAYLQWAH